MGDFFAGGMGRHRTLGFRAQTLTDLKTGLMVGPTPSGPGEGGNFLSSSPASVVPLLLPFAILFLLMYFFVYAPYL